MSAWKRKRDRWVAEGRCANCGNREQMDGVHRNCAKCRERARIYTKRRTKRRKAAHARWGVCVRCHQRDAMPNAQLCGVCSEDKAEASARWRVKRQEQGKCGRCTNDAVPGRKYCDKCLAIYRNNRREYVKRCKCQS